jgi:hypothetical protein
LTYRLVYRPDLDAIGLRRRHGASPDDLPTYLDLVTFRLAASADEHEESLTVTMSRAAWESQGAPEELSLSLSAPTPTEETDRV